MKTAIELIRMGRDIADNYIKDNTPLTSSLIKVASLHGLNQQEITRVAEAANIDTYLKVIERTDDKYVEFPLADAEEAFKSLNVKTASTENSSDDYEDIKKENTFSFAYYKPFEKKAHGEEVLIIPADPMSGLKKQAQRLKGTIEFIENNYYDEFSRLTQLVDKVQNLVKQAFLSGITFNDLSNIIKTAAPLASEQLIDSFKTKLAKGSPYADFGKKAEHAVEDIDTTTELYTSLVKINTLVETLQKYAELHTEYVDNYNLIAKENKLGFQKGANLATEVMRAYPKSTAVAGLTIGAGVFAGYRALKEEKRHNANGLSIQKVEAAIPTEPTDIRTIGRSL
jgi:hypothetical protein